MTARAANEVELRPVGIPLLLAIGAALCLRSGLTGVGGGIFLSPLVIFFRWAHTRTVSGIAAAFILVNSIAGLAGQMTGDYSVPAALPLWLAVVFMGGFIGAM